jgi:LPS-assembly protein
MIRTVKLTPLLLMLLVGIYVSAEADEKAAPELACPGPSLAPMIKDPPDRSQAPISVKTREFDASSAGAAEARKQVELSRADQLLTTDILQYDPDAKVVTIPGRLFYEDSILHIAGSSANYDFLQESGYFKDVEYGLVGSSAKGSADDISVKAGNHTVMNGIRFTTCPGNDPEWLLSAKQLDLDFENGVGKARGARLRLFDIPFLYLPYMKFPIDDRRKSGFLYPYISTANDNGFEISAPYYWNIAPNQDATITPRYFTERGAMLTGEYRFLTRRTNGELNFDYMNDDQKTDDSRYHVTLVHRASLSKRWRSDVLFDRVSDDQYFQDFSNSLADASRQYVRSKAGIYGSGRHWSLSMLVDDFQVVDDAVIPTNEPYTRLPRIYFDLDRPIGLDGMRLQMDAELVYFDRSIGATGARFDVFPRLEWNIDTDWGYIRPSAGYRYTAYSLDWHGMPGEKSLNRGTEIISFDTGMFFAKNKGEGKSQTLEPRLFYLYIPYKNQEDFPDFDSAPFTFGFSQLFHYNRYTGADRQSDANQLTLALTTRSLDNSLGRELWSLSFGQILYFDTLRVLPAEFGTVIDDKSSPFIAEFVYFPTRRLRSRINAQWNWQTSQIDVAILGATYTSDKGMKLGAEYRYRRDSLDQFDIRYYHPLNEKWRVLGRVNYSLQDSDLLAAEAGFEYESCCWALRVAARRFLRNREGDHRDAIYVQLILKGLGNIGRRSTPLFYDLAY